MFDVISVVWSAVLVGVLTYQSPREAGLGFLIVVVAGLVVYYLFLARRRAAGRGAAPVMAEVAGDAAELNTMARISA